MIDLYVNLVIAKKRTCNPENKKVRLVPKSLRDDVAKELKNQGYNLDGDRIA